MLLSQSKLTRKTPRKLIWTLDGITNRVEAVHFLMMFEDTFPVYHPYMEQIYFRYRFVIPPDSNQVIVEPDYELHERLVLTSEEGFEQHQMHILPGDIVGKTGLQVRYPRSKKSRNSRTMTTQLATAIKAFYFDYWMQGEQVIPVFSRQAIREYSEGMPNMELSFYDLGKNPDLSPFLRDAILNSVFERILALDCGPH